MYAAVTCSIVAGSLVTGQADTGLFKAVPWIAPAWRGNGGGTEYK